MSVQQVPRQAFLADLRSKVLGNDTARTIVVGEIARWSAEGKTIPEVEALTYVEFDDLDKSIIAEMQPDVVLSPLVAGAFDAFQIIRHLKASGFRGRYRAVSPSLPNLTMIQQEIVSAAPEIDFDIVIMPPTLIAV